MTSKETNGTPKLVWWLLGLSVASVLAMASAWAIDVKAQLDSVNKKIEVLTANVAAYSGEVRVRDVATSGRIDAVIIRVENNELRISEIKTLPTK